MQGLSCKSPDAAAASLTMLPLVAWPLESRRRIIGVFTDIDDTLTTQGAITNDALQSLHELKAAGLVVIAITGRPVGWSEPFAATWPVDAIVAENGSAALFSSQNTRENSTLRASNLNSLLSKSYQLDAAARAAHHAHLQRVLTRIEREITLAQRSADSAGRETDIAVDHSEFAQLTQTQIDQVVALMQSEGLQATVSSIHINGWLGDHNKLQGAYWIVRQLYGRDLSQEMDRWVYVGDSANDQLMFKAFDNSIGVANIARFADQLIDKPCYVTASKRGAGFAEVTHALLSVR
jgi:HAD superfamily hydrolase (TIGR01484 family)